MDEVWRGLDLQLQAGDIDGLHPVSDPFWPALAECSASFLAAVDDTACFGIANMDLTAASADAAAGKSDGVDTSAFFAHNDHRGALPMRQDEQQPVYSSSSLSSTRSLSIDSGGSSSTFFPLDYDAVAALPAATFSPAPLQLQQDPFAGDEEAMMLAMLAVISSAASTSPSSSESSSPLHRAAAAVQPRLHPHGGDDSASHVTVRSTSLAVAPERTTSAADAAGQQDDACKAAAAAAGSNNSSQVYHMLSERKRREKLNGSFHTLRSLLPPCPKKDKTTVLMNAASYVMALEAQVSELEDKNSKLQRYVPCGDGGGGGGATTATAAHRRARVHISRAASDEQQVSLMVMVMVECDIVDLVLHVLERLRWTSGVSVLSVNADTYSPQALLKALANIKLHIMDTATAGTRRCSARP
uniref:BHLH domain-containing protein n=1 Tax=Zea mays TaxID=4577 RepID=A0A804QS93_MAIZE